MSTFDNPDHRISATRTYFRIARDNLALFHEHKSARVSLESGSASEDEEAAIFEKIQRHFESQWECAMIAVTFAGMALEAFLFDYAADALGDQYVIDHLDKLDLPSKYLLYPKLVCGMGPQKGEHTFELVRNLTRLRNSLVHSKSKAFSLSNLGKAADHYEDYNTQLQKGLDPAIECVRAVMRELDKLHGNTSFEKYMEAG